MTYIDSCPQCGGKLDDDANEGFDHWDQPTELKVWLTCGSCSYMLVTKGEDFVEYIPQAR